MKYYPKIRALGHKETLGILDGPVVVQEKIDGSNFCFGKTMEGELFALSRTRELSFVAPEAVFRPALEHVKIVEHLIPDGTRFYCETLSKPKHNVLAYGRVPDGNIVLYEAVYSFFSLGAVIDEHRPSLVPEYARMLGVTCVPEVIVGDGRIIPSVLPDFLDKWKSVLGADHIEGVVVKNFNRFGPEGDILRAKVVRAEYREQHRHEMKSGKAAGETVEAVGLGLGGPMRWSKALLRLKEQGKIVGAECDIGPLFKQVKQDVLEECGAEVGEILWKMFQTQILHGATAGLADWYKNRLNQEELPQ